MLPYTEHKIQNLKNEKKYRHALKIYNNTNGFKKIHLVSDSRFKTNKNPYLNRFLWDDTTINRLQHKLCTECIVSILTIQSQAVHRTQGCTLSPRHLTLDNGLHSSKGCFPDTD